MSELDLKSLPELVIARIADQHPGWVVDRVIGYGSYFWGGFDPGRSDIDVAVLLMQTSPEADFPRLFWLPDLDHDVNFYVLRCDEIERNRKLTHAMPGKVLARGVTLYENDNTATYREQLSEQYATETYAQAKARYANVWLTRAQELLERAERSLQMPVVRARYGCVIHRDTISSAQAAAVFALWSLLYRADIDPSPHALRWNAPRLLAIASMFYPDLGLKPSVAKPIPTEHVLRMDLLRHFTVRKARAVLDAARTILAAVQKVTPETNNA
jgi:hypothetical protein